MNMVSGSAQWVEGEKEKERKGDKQTKEGESEIENRSRNEWCDGECGDVSF